MDCPICFNEFDLKERYPKVLTCGHTYCTGCVEDYVFMGNNRSCPFCKKGIGYSNIEEVPNNYSLMFMLERRKEQGSLPIGNDHNQLRESFKNTVVNLLKNIQPVSQSSGSDSRVFECNRNLVDQHGDLTEVYYQVIVPEDVKCITELRVKVWSKDQGWASVASSSSHVYMVLRYPGVENPLIHIVVCENYRMNDYVMREVHWTYDNEDHRKQLQLFKPGAIIQLIAVSRYPGWKCHVNRAIVEMVPYFKNGKKIRRSV